MQNFMWLHPYTNPMMSLLTNLSHFILMGLPLLVNVAFITLLERKILAFSQIRVGPMKTGVLGLLQPFADVVKLFLGQFSSLTYSLKSVYFFSPLLSLSLSLYFFMGMALASGAPSWEFSFLVLLLVIGMNVYPLLLSGWSSNSLYGFLGSMRGVSQTISFEISLAFIIISLFFLYNSCSLSDSLSSFSIWFFIPILALWGFSAVAELNRTPFDFSEGESELVSGFNIEYSSTKFALFFMAEYLMIISMSILTGVLFMAAGSPSVSTLLVSMLPMSLILWLRATLPRYRYDLLMIKAWKVVLPWSISLIQVILMMLICLK